MKNSTFTERFNRWKNGESYWDIIDKPLAKYGNGKDYDGYNIQHVKQGSLGKDIDAQIDLPDNSVVITGDASKNKNRMYSSAFDPDGVIDFYNAATGVGNLYNPFQITKQILDVDKNPKGFVEGILQAAVPFNASARAAYGLYNLVNQNGIKKTYNLSSQGQYGKAVLSGVGDLLNVGMSLEGLGGTLKVGNRFLKTLSRNNDQWYNKFNNTINNKGEIDYNPILMFDDELPNAIKRKAAEQMDSFLDSYDYKNRINNSPFGQNIIDIIKNRYNNINFFPAKYTNNFDIEHSNLPTANNVLGMSTKDGILLNQYYKYPHSKLSTSDGGIYPVLMHELSHYSTRNKGIDFTYLDIDDIREAEELSKMMRYNELLAKNKNDIDILKSKGITNLDEARQYFDESIDNGMTNRERIQYLKDPQEKRARAIPTILESKQKGIPIDELIDNYTDINGNIKEDAPGQLRDLGEILDNKNLKKYLNNFLSVTAPITIYNKLKQQDVQQPSYKNGKDSIQNFVSTFRPMLYNTLQKKGYHTNSMDNMLTQLAWESNYGKSNNAKRNYNYGGVKSGNDYAKYNSPEDFVEHYVDLIHNRYPNAFNSNDLSSYAKALKDNGYYEDSLQHYSSNLNNMKSLRQAIDKERLGNLSKYNSDVSFDQTMSQPQDAIRSYKQNIVQDIPTYTPTQQTKKQMIYPSYVQQPNKLPNIMDVYSNMINGRPLLNMPGR